MDVQEHTKRKKLYFQNSDRDKERPFMIFYGYMVYCSCGHYYEPEGIVLFDHDPKIGDTFRSCDGHEYILTKVNTETLEAWSQTKRL